MTHNLRTLLDEAVNAFPYELESTGFTLGELEVEAGAEVNYRGEYSFKGGRILDEELITSGWINLRRDTDGKEPIINALFGVARHGEWQNKDAPVLLEYTGILGWYDMQAKTWELSIDPPDLTHWENEGWKRLLPWYPYRNIRYKTGRKNVTHDLQPLFDEAVQAFPYELESTGCTLGELEVEAGKAIGYIKEYYFELGQLLDKKLMAKGWIELRRDTDEEEPTITALFSVVRNGDRKKKDARLLLKCTGIMGWYDMQAKTWQLNIEEPFEKLKDWLTIVCAPTNRTEFTP